MSSRVGELDVRQLVPRVAAAVGGGGLLQHVQRLAHRAVADGVDVDAEPGGVAAGDVAGQVLQPVLIDAVLAGGRAGRVQVGIEHGGGAVLDHAVVEELDVAAVEPPDGAAEPALDQLVELRVVAEGRLPGQVAANAQGQLAGPCQPLVGLLVVRLDGRVLAGGDPQPVVVLLRRPQPGGALIGVRLRAPGRAPGPSPTPAACPPARRAGRARSARRTGRACRGRSRPAPAPGCWPRRRGSRCWAGPRAGRRRPRPAAGGWGCRPGSRSSTSRRPGSSRGRGWLRRTRAMRRRCSSAPRLSNRSQSVLLVPAHRQVAVRILEAGQHHAALHVDGPRPRPGQLRDLRCAAHGDDAAVRRPPPPPARCGQRRPCGRRRW